MKLFIDTFKDSIINLIDVGLLNQSIKEFETYNKTLYTQESFELYETAVQTGKDLLVNGTKDSISARIIVINEKKNALVIKLSNALNDVIKDILKLNSKNYTQNSFNSLMVIVKEAQALVSPTTEQQTEYIKKISNSKNALVSIAALKERVDDANKLDEALYTKKSFENIKISLKKASEIIISGKQGEVNIVLELLTQSIQKLEKSGVKELGKYRETLVIKDAHYYTTSSYEVYKKAYMVIKEFTRDVSLKELNIAINNLEEATTKLILKKADYSELKKLINQIPKDLSSYASQSVNALNTILASFDYNKDITEQNVVDLYVKNLESAISNLKKELAANGSKPGDVETSDRTNIAMILSVITLAGMGIYVFKRRKENL